MRVYYIISRYEWIGSLNEDKIRKMYSNKAVYNCDISEFTGKLLSIEYVD